MRNVIIIKGSYGYQPEGADFVQPITRRDGAIALPDEEAARLVRLRVAAYCGEVEPEEINSGVATPEGGEDEEAGGDDLPDGESGAEGEGAALSKPEYDSNTSFDDLKELIKGCGLVFRVGMSRSDLIAALDEYYSQEDDQPPSLGVEEPVS